MMPHADTPRLNITSAYYPHQFNSRYTPLQTLIIAGTPLMVAQLTLALDLPLKVRAWFAAGGKVWPSYNDFDYLKQRFSLSDELVKNIAVIAPLINRALQ